MTADLVSRWAHANGLAVAPEPFGLHQLANEPPAGADQTPTPNAENAVFLVDAKGRPAAVVFASHGGRWMTSMGELCRWMRLSAFVPPRPGEDGERHFIAVMRSGAAEPVWLPEQL